MSAIQQRIHETIEEIQNLNKIKLRYDDLQEQLQASYNSMKSLHASMTKELLDLEAMEKTSIKSVFHKVLGSKEEQIEKERQEYLQASLKYNESQKSVEILEFENELLKKKLKDTSQLEKQLGQLKRQRENEIIQSDPTLAEELISLSDQYEKTFLIKREISEAFAAGKVSLQTLGVMVQELSKAKDWGQWDMAGRDRRASYHKHGAIDRAKNLSIRAKRELHKFSVELRDITGESFNFQISMDDFSRFTDIFFDNLISDWVIQKKIVNALSNVMSIRDKVSRIIQSLDGDAKKLDQQLASLNQQKDQVLLR